MPPAGTIQSSWLRRLLGYCLRHRGAFAIAFATSLAGALVSVAVPLVVRHVIDIVDVPASTGHRASVRSWVILLLVAAVIQYVLTAVRRYAAGRLSLDVQLDMRADVFGALQRLDGAAQDSLQTGQVVSRSITDVGLVQGLLAFMPMLAGNVLLFVISLVAMVFLSPLLTLVALAMIPALWVLALASRRDLFPANWSAQQEAGTLVGQVEAAVTGVRVVKGFGQEEREVSDLSARARTLFANRMRVVVLQAKYSSSLTAVPGLGQIGVLLLGGYLALRGDITLGTFLAFSTYLGQLVGPVRQLTGLLTIGQQARAGVERVLEVIDAHPEIVDPEQPTELPDGPLSIAFNDVSFGYSRSEPVLHHVQLTVRPGETLALMGGAGSGKSTLALLVPRFYDPHQGAIEIGGVDLRQLRMADVRQAIGMVFEESLLFSDTIAANIAYGQPDAAPEQIVAAARAAEAHEFIEALPDGYQTIVGERGMTLSGGQRQRISLARALLTEPRMMLLDDATSAVDAGIETEILATLSRLIEHRTTLLIAHRRSTLALADRIAVLERGRIVDLGTFAQLEQRSALFRLLLAGPGDDAEGIDAGELAAEREAAEEVRLNEQVDGVTPELWRPTVTDDSAPVMTNAARAALGGGAGGGPGAHGGMFTGIPPTPELLAKVAALPPATATPDMDDAQTRAPDPEFNLRRLLSPLRVAFALGIGLIGVDTGLQLLLPSLVRSGIDHGVSDKDTARLFLISAIALGVLVVDWIVSAGGQWLTGRTGERLLFSLRVKAFAHLQRLGLDYYERELGGRIMTRMTTDVDALSNFLQTGLATALVSVLTLLGVLIALVLIDAQLSLVLVAALPILFAATWLFRRLAVPAYEQARERVSTVNAQLQENVAGVRVAQAFGREEHDNTRYLLAARGYRNSRLRAQTYISAYFPFVQMVADICSALVLAFGASRLQHGTLTVGALIAFFLYLDAFFAPVQQLSQVFDGYQQAAVGLSRLRELLRTPTSTPAPLTAQPLEPRLRGEIALHEVVFSYAGSEEPAVAGVDLVVPAGQRVALVGETGAGKSTIVKLLARFYDPGAGRVCVDGHDLRTVDLSDYRHHLGYVPQEAYLSPGPIRNAIAYGRPQATDADVERAAREVGAHAMIASLRGGYLHEVGERGRNLSAGQRQLIALARAQLVDPDILLFDEATAALDLASEAAVTEATDRLARHRTTIVVAHRLSTAARADRIVVMSHGRIAEDGTHAQLIEDDGMYARLWRDYRAGSDDGSQPNLGEKILL